MRKLFAFLGILFCFGLSTFAVSADTFVIRADTERTVGVFTLPYSAYGVPSGYKVAYVTYLTQKPQRPFNPCYIYACYVPSDADYIIAPDWISSEGLFPTSYSQSLKIHMPNGSYATMYQTSCQYVNQSSDPDAMNYVMTSESGGYTSNPQPLWYTECYMPVKRANGDSLFVPSQLSMSNFLDNNKQLHFTVSITGDIDSDVPVDFIMIPSSVDVGSRFNITPQYERSLYATTDGYIYADLGAVSPIAELDPYKPFIRQLLRADAQQGIYHDTIVANEFGKSRVAIPIPYFSNFKAVALPASFDINDYTSDYVGIGGDIITPSVHRTSVFTVDVPAMDKADSSRIPLYQHDNIAVIAVARFPTKVEVARFDFSRSQIMSSKHTPAVTHEPIDSIDNSTGIDTLQDLADYLQYVYNTTNNNTYITYNNAISDLQEIPWDNYIVGGLANFMPQLNGELRDLFGSLGNDWFSLDDTDFSDLTARQNQLDELIDYKFGWYTDFQDEVEYIHTTIIDSGNDTPEFKVNFNGKFGLQEVSIIDFAEVPYVVRDKVRDVISVFACLAVVMYIWRTIPSTIGNEPS